MPRLHAAIWLARLLPARSRERVFAAAYDDLLGDYLTSRRGAGVAPPPHRAPRKGSLMESILRDLTEDTGPQVYYPWARSGGSAGVIFVRTAGDPSGVLGMMREELRAIDAEIPVLRAATMDDHLSDSLAMPRLGVRFLSGFGAVALVLASLGLYGIVSFAVGRRTLEVGVRMALGADSAQVVWLVMREVAVLVGFVGILVGLGLSVVANAALAGVLFGVSPADPVTLALVSLLLLAVALGAAMIPAQRAAGADPVVALRQG